MKIEAKTFEDAYHEATEKLNCSINDLDIEVIQKPSEGFLGMFKKNAIISISKKGSNKKEKHFEAKKSDINHEIKKADIKKNQSFDKNIQDKIKPNQENNKKNHDKKLKKEKFKKISQDKNNTIVNDDILNNIKNDIEHLMSKSGFNISEIKVLKLDENGVQVYLDGEDSALLIGKEGHRYRAISYILQNIINVKYNLFLKLEISDFIKNQEEVLQEHLQAVIEKVKANGKAQTKPINAILVKHALSILRQTFPDKYVGFKNTKGNRKIIFINNFRK